MGIFGQHGARLGLGTGIILVVPVIAFPGRIGGELGAWLVWPFALELAYYTVTIYLFNRKAAFQHVAILAAAALGYRLLMGFLFGTIVSLIYSIPLVLAVKLGVYAYLPAVILQIAGTPYALKGILESTSGGRPVARPTRREPAPMPVQHKPIGNSIAISREKGIVSESHSFMLPDTERRPHGGHSAADSYSQLDQTGFDRAVRYLGESGSVFLALVVDREGLLLGNFKRGSLIPEDWAPLALVLYEQNNQALGRSRLGMPEKVEVVFHEKRLVVAHGQEFSLLVLAERQADDTLAIRITQAMELIRKYFAERYSCKHDVNAEKIHVSRTR